MTKPIYYLSTIIESLKTYSTLSNSFLGALVCCQLCAGGVMGKRGGGKANSGVANLGPGFTGFSGETNICILPAIRRDAWKRQHQLRQDQWRRWILLKFGDGRYLSRKWDEISYL